MPADRERAIGELVAEWTRRARADLALAQMTRQKRIAPEILAFHAQQAVEKALKALLVRHQVEFPNTHSIGLLLNLVQEAGVEGIQGFANAVALTRYAVSTRYPGEDDPVTREEAKEASRLAVRLVSWVEAQLGK